MIRSSRLVLKFIGLVLIVWHFTKHPFVLQLPMVALYLLIFLTVTVLHVFAIKPLVDEIKRLHQRRSPTQYATRERLAVERRFDRLFSQVLRKPFFNLLLAIGEDGLFLVPLIWYGIEPLSVILVAVAFGALHYPKFSVLQCASKALAYFLVCWFVLPYGLLNMLLGHLLLDTIFLGLASLRAQRYKNLLQKSADA